MRAISDVNRRLSFPNKSSSQELCFSDIMQNSQFRVKQVINKLPYNAHDFSFG